MRVVARDAGADVDHRAPLGELRAELPIFDEPLAQAVEALGDDLARAEGQGLGARVDLDARQRARFLDDLDQRRAVRSLLPDRLVIENDAGNMLRHRFGAAEQKLAIVAPAGRRRIHADGVETLFDRAARFIGGQDAAARSDHGLGDFVEFREIHRAFLEVRINSRLIMPNCRPWREWG